MSDMYGISNAIMEQNSLHGQLALNREAASSDFNTELDKFNTKIKDRHMGDTSQTEFDVAKDLPDINDGLQAGKGVYAGLAGAAMGGKEAANTFIATGAARRASRAALAGVGTQGRTSAVLAGTGAEDVSMTPALFQDAGKAAATTLDYAGEGTRLTGATLAGAAKGAVSGLIEQGGAATGFTGTLQGVEGIAQKAIRVAGGGEPLAMVAGKAAGAAGGIISGVGQISSLLESDGKTAFDRTDSATGQLVRESGATEASGFLNEAGAAADILAAGTGGLLVPVAAALNLAGAITGVIGEFKDQKSDDASVGIGADGKPMAGTKPKQAGEPISEAFTGLGFVGNQSHNPLDHIS
tara:strand:+ start:1789 stop:2847 length:1059 start_codon:yes stop_codon:yes gene_type:complete